MCGICGIVNFAESDVVDQALVQRMTQAIAHRGPDDASYFVDGRVGLGHRRLSIIDLRGGGQPIFNEDRSAAIIFNGEIYNYQDLMPVLKAAGHAFRTRSDTETILHAYEEYGDDCVHQLRGMFGFAIWDRRRHRLLLARDRLGVKPIYYYQDRRRFAFASEIKSLLEIPSIPREVDTEALDLYLALRYVPGPRTMFKNIFRLQPGHRLVADSEGVRVTRYWDIDYSVSQSSEDVLRRFQDLLEESVRLRLIAEVPLGVFLSGGLDSSAILASMSKIAPGRVKTFSVGYDTSNAEEESANEFAYARLAAGAFASDHHEYRLNARTFAEFVPRLVWHLDEPLADPTCIPLYFISKLAREHITVVLSGEGADEILAGYGIYGRMLALDRIYRGFGPLRRLPPWIASLTPSEKVRHYLRMCAMPLEARYQGVSRGLSAAVRRRLIGEDRTKRADQRLCHTLSGHFRNAKGASPLNQMLYLDAKVWLPDDLLIKADKMTMANGLELRVPFLDHRMVEFAATLPDACKLHNGRGKALLRAAMRGHLPAGIIDRPKKGFPIPIASWFRTSLRQFTRDHLLVENSAVSRYVESREVRKLIEEQETGRADRSQEIWTLLVLEFWHRQFIESHAPSQQPVFEAREATCGELS